MELDDLRQAQSEERRSEKLQELSDTFYEDAAEYIESLREERDACDDPYSEKARRIDDALSSARQVTEAIYERRVGKVVKTASLAANGHTANESRMTLEEREMFGSIVAEIRANQSRIEETLEGALGAGGATESDATQVDGSATDVEADSTGVTADVGVEDTDTGAGAVSLEEHPKTEAAGTNTGATDGGGSPDDTDGYKTVRVVESLPEFVGTDGRQYSLGEEDVARIPEENARALCEKEAAVEVSTTD